MDASVANGIWSLGLMSGTSLDGIDAALLRTDGERVLERGPAIGIPYTADVQSRLRVMLDQAQSLPLAGPLPSAFAEIEAELTHLHAKAVRALLQRAQLTPSDVSAIGFHGQTILHRPGARQTLQLGLGALLAAETGIDVVSDFRSADVRAGGQGAPLVPLYHQALVRAAMPGATTAILNIGGVANVTWIGPDGLIIAGDTGPGNALIDDWARKHTGRAVDEDGRLAAAGRIEQARLDRGLAHPWFVKPLPKSLDRLDFSGTFVDGLSPEDGAATLTAFTAAAVRKVLEHLPHRPDQWIVCGGGRHNPELMRNLARELGNTVINADDLGWRGDALEAEAFAFLAVRSLRGLPLSLPTTTGAPRAMTGGVLHLARRP
ncbi:MAG TPA: anhydro-N-acetylmuramic acid kinase [Alphaproteobacteria bacterium]|nr:anhydro-N-acetylmuramic acid kinase [Alphaproteobacteria bacterium]